MQEMHTHIQLEHHKEDKMLSRQELEVIKAFIKRATMQGDEAFEYVKLCNRIQAEIDNFNKRQVTKEKGE